MSEPNTPTPDSRDERIGRILNDFHDRRARGETVTVEGLLAAHPDLADDLKPYLEMLGDLRSEGDRIQRLVADGVLRESDDPAYQATLGDYKTVGFIGRGGMGIVLKAYEESLGRTVALKVLRPELADDKASLQRFTREAKAAGMLRHPNIVTVYAVGEQHGVNYIAMEYIEGPTLADVIHEQAPLPTETIRGLFGEVLLGLAAAHESGIIHRDIKSANMLLDGGAVKPIRAGFCEAGAARDVNEAGNADTPASGTGPTRPGSDSIFNLRPSSLRLKIADFGLALMAASQTRITLPDSSPGTPEYMSPEQARGDEDIDHRADLYSAGIVLYEMLTGRTPFKADVPSAVIHQILHEEPADPRTVNEQADPHLASLAMRLMAKRPEDRFASTREAIEALQASERVSLPAQRRKHVRRAVGVLTVVMLIAGGWYLTDVLAAHAMRISDIRVAPEKRHGVEVRRGNNTEWETFCKFGFSQDGRGVLDARLVDQDGAGNQAVIVALESLAEGHNLFAFSEYGEELWRQNLSSNRRWPDCSTPAHWCCDHLIEADLDGKPGDEVVVVANDEHSYPTRISVIDPRTGEIRSTFWHMGQFAGIRIEPDFFGGERHAIIAWGVNNKLDGFGQSLPSSHDRDARGEDPPRTEYDVVPVAVILDPTDMDGLSPPRTDRIPDIPPARPFAYTFIDAPAGGGTYFNHGDAQRVRPRPSQVCSISWINPLQRAGAHENEPWMKIGSETLEHGAVLTVDRNLVLREVEPVTGQAADSTEAYWREHWRVIIQNSKYVDE